MTGAKFAVERLPRGPVVGDEREARLEDVARVYRIVKRVTGWTMTWRGRRPLVSTWVPRLSTSTALVGERNRLQASARPRRFLEDTRGS